MTYRSAICLFSCLALAGWSCATQVSAQTELQPPYPRRRPATGAASTPARPTRPAAGDVDADKPTDRYLAVTGAMVHTIAGPTLDGPTVLCKNGKILAIGRDMVIPDKTETLDATGYHLYPGLVAISSSSILGSEPPEDNTDLYGLALTLGLSGGVTTAATGNTVAKLTYGTLEDHVLRRNAFYTLNYSRSAPDTRRRFRQTLDRVRQYLRDVQSWEEAKKTNPAAKEPDKSWLKREYETALKLLKHEITALATANTAQDLRDLANLSGNYGFQLVVRGAYEGWIVAPELARAGVRAVITPRTRRDADERLNRPNGSSIENARILHEHGVLFGILPLSTRISTSGLAGRDLWHLPMEASFAVRGGLPEDAALRAITIDAARILGVDHRVGSIEVGKDADFAIVDGDLLHYMTMVRWTLVNGRIAYDKKKEGLLDHIRPDGKLQSPPPSDYWPRSLGQQ